MMETVLEHKIETEIAGLPPRRARLSGGLLRLLVAAYLMLGLFMLGSGRALWDAGNLGWLGLAGRTVAGRIVEVQTEPLPNESRLRPQVAARYVAFLPAAIWPPERRTGWISLGRGGIAPPVGQSLPYRYAPWFGGVAGAPWQPVPTGRLLSLLLSGGLVLLATALLLRRLTRWLHERLHLLRGGRATVGTIIHKRTESEDTVHYFLRYGYAPAPGAEQDREEQVSQDQWKQFEVGQPVTVLYDSDQPDRAGLYALMQ